MIKLRTFGECVIEIGGEAFTPESDALFAALLYLGVERGKRVSRDRLAELIWPRTTPKRARHCLRQILYRLRMLGVEFEGARESVMLPDAAVEPTFSAAPAPDRLAAERSAGTLVLGPFLPGYRPPHSEPYAEWLDATRAEFESRVRRSLLELAQVHRLRGEWADVDALARECLRLDPLNEEANLAIAEAAAMTGGKSEAIAILDRYIHDLGARGNDLRLPATVLRRRIAERFPARRYSVPSDRCFVGRGALLETLATALLRARNGESSAVMLTGAPGIGKTRLVQELTSLAVMQGVRTVRVGCDEADAQRPMSAWVDAVPRLRELPGALGIAPESLRFLRRLTEIDPTDAVLAEPLRDPRWIANRIRQAIVDLLDAVTAEGTVLLVIEDVHWLDGASWAAITALLEWMTNRRFLLVLTTRGPHPAPATPSRCIEQLAVCPVPALDGASAIALGQAIIEDHGGTLSEETLRWCVEVGEGNPLFLRELAVHCLEGGSTKHVPPPIQLLIDARIGRLPSCARRVAEALAILGNFATLERLETMLQLPAHELAGALVDLGRAMLLADDTAMVRLRHDLVRARILAGVPPVAQRLLHRRAAIAIEPEVLSRSGLDLVWELISHARESGEEARSRSLVLHAASQQLLLGAPRDAAVLLERSLPLLSDSELYSAALRLLCRALSLDGQWRGAHLIAEELVRVSKDTSDRETTTRDLLVLFQTGVRSGQDPKWLGQLVLPIAIDECENPALRIQAARCGLTLSQISGATLGSEAFYDAIADLRTDSASSSIQLDEVEMIYEANVGSLASAVRVANRLRRHISDAIDPFDQLSLFVAVSDTYRMSDERKSALHVASDGLRVARQIGSDHFELTLLGRILTIQLELGLLNEAQSCIHIARALAVKHGSGILSEAIDVIDARIALAQGRTEAARALAARCLQSLSTDAYSLLAHRRIIVTLAAEVALRTSPAAIDSALTDELLDIHKRAQRLALHDRSMAVLVAALKRAGRSMIADELLTTYLSTHRRAGAPWEENVEHLGLTGYGTGLRRDASD